MPPKEENGALEKLREKLYDPDASVDLTKGKLTGAPAPVARGWEAAPKTPLPPPAHARLPLPVKFFIGALIFCAVTGLATGAYLIFGGRSISADNVDILVVGPTTAASGEAISLLITVQNRNPVPIDVQDLGIDFPVGTRDADAIDTELTHQSIELGTIEPGDGETRTIRATLFGSENQTLSIPIRVEYETEGSNAVFVSTKTYEITITTSPLSINTTSVTETSAGQSVTFSLAVRANATDDLENVAVEAQYPFGFTVTNTSIDSRNSGTFFALGTLKAGEERRFTVTGTLAGATDDIRVFRWGTGLMDAPDAGRIAIPYANAVSEIALKRPFLDVALAINNDPSAKPVIKAGDPILGLLTWKNTLASSILDGKITVKLSGSALDPAAVGSGSGFYQSADLSILFDRDTAQSLRELESGDTGTGTFFFASKDTKDMGSMQRPEITITVSVAGRRIGETGVPENLTSTLTRTVKIGTELTLASKVQHDSGPFNNTGPLPPVAGQKTTYTVVLAVDNSVNEVAGATATMTLPSYVRFTGLVSPTDSGLTYSDTTRTVNWNIGSVAAHGGKEVAFQVELSASLSQQDSSPILVSPQKLTGTDRFTQTAVGMTAGALTIEPTGDPGYQLSDGQVQ